MTDEHTLAYYIFDLLYLDGYDIRSLPLNNRKELLSLTLPQLPTIKLCDHVENEGVAFFQAIEKLGLEGMVGKNSESTYQSGIRSSDWVKVKHYTRRGWNEKVILEKQY